DARVLRPEQIELKLEYTSTGDDSGWQALPSGRYRTADGTEVSVDGQGLLRLSKNDGWRLSLTGLPAMSTNGQAYAYRVTEIRLLYKDGQICEVKDGDAGRYHSSGTTTQDADGNWKAVLTNQLLDRYQARITKHAETLDGSVLEGAGYVLYRPDKTDYYTGQDREGNAVWGIWNDAKILYTGKNGTVTVSGLSRGTYQFIEVVAAKGYRIDTSPVEFEIGNDNIGTLVDVHQADRRLPNAQPIDTPSGEHVILVGPPKTGDSDDWRVYAGMAAGLLLAIFALLRSIKKTSII
ncbi:MAG: hypothetical protein MR462_08085, partial [Clostridiaceae bacterium]|nr:hypothetical protein [Clostridiaceae bacterium]